MQCPGLHSQRTMPSNPRQRGSNVVKNWMAGEWRYYFWWSGKDELVWEGSIILALVKRSFWHLALFKCLDFSSGPDWVPPPHHRHQSNHSYLNSNFNIQLFSFNFTQFMHNSHILNAAKFRTWQLASAFIQFWGFAVCYHCSVQSLKDAFAFIPITNN